MSLSSNEIRAFLEIASTQNLSRAAERLGTSQPALSLLVKRLENYFGVTLFLRTKHGVELTKPAVKFAEEGQRILKDLDALREDVLNQDTGLQGVYSIGFHPQIASFSFPQIGRELLEKNDDLQIKLVQEPSRKVLAEVISFRVDFGIVVNPRSHPDLVVVPLYEDKIHFWTRKVATRLQRPKEKSAVVIYDKDLPQMEALYFKARAEKKLMNQRTLHSADLDVIREFVISGIGIGILPSTIAKKHKPDSVVALSDFPTFEEKICLVYRADFQKSQAAKYILKRLREIKREV